MSKTNNKATPVISKSLEELSSEELLAFAKQLQEQFTATETAKAALEDSVRELTEKVTAAETVKAEMQITISELTGKVTAAEAKVAAITQDATETINSLSIEVAKHTSVAQFNAPVVKHGKKLVALVVPSFNFNGKDYIASEIQDDDPILDELEEIGSNIYQLTSKKA